MTHENITTPLTEKKFWPLLIMVTLLFMGWGIAMTMGDVLNRHFQNVLGVSKAQSGLVQFSIFGAYAIMAIPAGLFMNKFGYKRGVLLGLSLYALGAFLFLPAAQAESFSFFRFALFVLACGMATLETVAHPFVAALGPQNSSDRRLNFAQSFNGVGAVLGPVMGSYFLLRENESAAASPLSSVQHLYLGIGIAVFLVALVFVFLKVPNEIAVEKSEAAQVSYWQLLKVKQLRRAAIAQFFNVAAQGGTWAFFINYGVEKMGFTDEQAGYFFSLSMVNMMLGRFIGTFLMKFISPRKLLAAYAAVNILCCLLIAQSAGWLSFGALLMLNFFFSIMFPTIFSLGLKNLGPAAPKASSLIVMGIMGGAFFPRLMGQVANIDVAWAYYMPILCYAVILWFALKATESRVVHN